MNYGYNKFRPLSVHDNGLIALLLLFLLGACQEGIKEPDVSHIEMDIEWIRYDSLLFEMDTSRITAEFPEIKEEYPAFTQLYFRQILGMADTFMQAKGLVKSDALRALYDSVSMHYDQMPDIKSSLRQGLKYYKYYFPDQIIPDMYTCITEFSVASFVFLDEEEKDALGVSLDMYLGKGFPYEKMGSEMPTFSKYLTRTFNRDHLVKKTLQTLVEDKLPPLQDERLIDHMIQNGKSLYVLHHLLPNIIDTILFEYTPAELEWCRNNQAQMWAFLIDKDLLYSRNRSEISTLIRPAPSSMGMPPESPGRTANFIGYQIVSKYMERMGEIGLQALLEETDAQEILTRSRYKGR